MTFTELAQEVLYRCGEGYQDYLSRCKEHLLKNIDDIINTGVMSERDYYGLILSFNDGYSNPYPIHDLLDGQYQMLKLLTVYVGSDKIDELSVNEKNVTSKLGTLFGKGYFYREGALTFLGISSASTISIEIIKRYTEPSPETDLRDTFTVKFTDALIDLTVQTLYKEINS